MIAILTKKLFDKLRRKPYRDAFVEENVRTGIAYQIRALREARGLTQKRFAEILGKPPSVLSRIEDPDYGKLSVQTLLEVAAALDVALLVQYVNFPDFLERTRDVSPEGLNRESFSETQFAAFDGSKRDMEQISSYVTLTISLPDGISSIPVTFNGEDFGVISAPFSPQSSLLTPHWQSAVSYLALSEPPALKALH